VSDLRHNLKREFQNEDYRYAYAESFLNTKLAAQIKVLREARGKTQTEMGCLIGTKQSGFSRFEDVNHTVWKTDTLWKIARALGVRLDISFETFGNLIDQKERFSRETLERPDFTNDPVFFANDSVHFGNDRVYFGKNVYIGNRSVFSSATQIIRNQQAHGALSQISNVIQLPPQGISGGVGFGRLAFGSPLEESQTNSEQAEGQASALLAARA